MLRFLVSRSSKSLFSAPFVFAAFLIWFAPVSSDAAGDPELGQVYQVGSGSPGAVVAGICSQPHPGQSFFSSRQGFIFAIRRLCSSLWSNSLQDYAGHSQGAAPFHQNPLVEVMATFLLKMHFLIVLSQQVTRRQTGLHNGQTLPVTLIRNRRYIEFFFSKVNIYLSAVDCC